MPILSGSALSFATLVLVVVVAQMFTLFILSVLLHVWALSLAVRYKTLGS